MIKDNTIPSVSWIRKNLQYKGYGQFLNDHFMALFSPYITRLCIKFGVIPNYVTLAMVVFGVIGAFFYLFPSLPLKILGIVFIYLWYLMDVVDGEVARATKQFSKYGKEFDYTAHVIDHPCYTIAFTITVFDYSIWFSLMIICLGFTDSIFRSMQSFQIIRTLKEPESVNQSEVVYPKGYIIKYIFLNLSTFPLFALVFSVLVLISWKVAFVYSICVLFASIVICMIGVNRWIKVMLHG